MEIMFLICSKLALLPCHSAVMKNNFAKLVNTATSKFKYLLMFYVYVLAACLPDADNAQDGD